MEGKKFGAPEPIHGFESTARAPPHSPLSVPAVYAMFRILCYVSRAGSVIGTDGNVIKQLKESTNSSISVEMYPSDSKYCVIRIVAVVGSPSWVKLGEQEEEVIEVSTAQNALIRAFEVVNVFKTTGKVSCRLLIEASYVDAVIGDESDELIERIRKETGCSVDIFQDDLPKPGDVMVKIEGNVLSVKKALVSISSHLQDRQSIDIAFQRSLQRHNEVVPQDALQRTMDVVPREASYRSRQYREVDPRDSLHRHVEISEEDALVRSFDPLTLDAYQRRSGGITQETLSQPRIGSLSHPTSVHSLSAFASEYHPVTTKQHSLPESKDFKRQVVLKILCSNESASSVIGQESSTIRALQSETGVSISVGDTLADCDERLITITGLDNIEDRNSPAQRAFVLVFSRLYETATENDSITARLVVPSNQILDLVGRKAHKIPEMKKRSGAFIQVLKVDQNPKCVADNNQIVQISGRFPNVKEAINHVTIKLVENMTYQSFDVTSRPVDADPCITSREYPFPNMFTPTAGYAPNFGRPPTMDLNDIYRHSSQTPFWSQTPAAPRGVHDGIGSGGLPSTRDDLRLDRLISSNDTNTTVEFRVPENDVDFVFGDNVLEDLRLVSGARIRVPELYGGTRDRIIVISGTPHQIQRARNLLHSLTSVTLV